MAYLTVKLPHNNCSWTPHDHDQDPQIHILDSSPLRDPPPSSSYVRPPSIFWQWLLKYIDEPNSLRSFSVEEGILWQTSFSLVWSDRPKDQVLLVPLLCNLTNCTFWYKTFLTLALIVSASKKLQIAKNVQLAGILRSWVFHACWATEQGADVAATYCAVIIIIIIAAQVGQHWE